MKRLFLPFILFILLVCEGVATELLPSSLLSENILVAAHWVFIFLLLILFLYDTDDTFVSIIYGICFGLLIDIVYTGILGVYMFIYPVTLYLMHLVKRFLQTNVYMIILTTIVSLFIVEGSLFVIYTIVGSIQTSFHYFLLYRFIPTMIANVIFLLPLYLLTSKKLRHYRQEQFEK